MRREREKQKNNGNPSWQDKGNITGMHMAHRLEYLVMTCIRGWVGGWVHPPAETAGQAVMSVGDRNGHSLPA